MNRHDTKFEHSFHITMKSIYLLNCVFVKQLIILLFVLLYVYISIDLTYINTFQVNKMTLDERHGSSSSNSSDESSDGSFIIKSTDPKRPPLWFVCHAHSAESRSEWLQNLRQILQTQQDFLKAIQSPIAYQKEQTKEAS